MGEEKKLGKIDRATYGTGGYQEAMHGLSLSFSGSNWGVSMFDGWWSNPPTPGAIWTEAERMEAFAKTALLVIDTLRKAKVDHVGKLVGIPVEVTFEGNTLKSWRVLEEVL